MTYKPDSLSVSPWVSRNRWNGKPDSSLDGILEDLVKVISPGVQAGSDAIKGKTASFVNELIASSEFKKVTDKINSEVESTVVAKIKENAFVLIALSVIGGVVGGTIFKGPVGVSIAGGLAGLGAYQILKAPKTKK